jgi:hypothetical protein
MGSPFEGSGYAEATSAETFHARMTLSAISVRGRVWGNVNHFFTKIGGVNTPAINQLVNPQSELNLSLNNNTSFVNDANWLSTCGTKPWLSFAVPLINMIVFDVDNGWDLLRLASTWSLESVDLMSDGVVSYSSANKQPISQELNLYFSSDHSSYFFADKNDDYAKMISDMRTFLSNGLGGVALQRDPPAEFVENLVLSAKHGAQILHNGFLLAGAETRRLLPYAINELDQFVIRSFRRGAQASPQIIMASVNGAVMQAQSSSDPENQIYFYSAGYLPTLVGQVNADESITLYADSVDVVPDPNWLKPRAGSVVINNGATETTSTTVQLTLLADNATEFAVYEDGQTPQWRSYTGGSVQHSYTFADSSAGRKTIIAEFRNAYGEGPLTTAQITLISFGDTLNSPELTWSMGGHADWFAQSQESRDGLAAQSGTITHNQQSWMQTTVTGPGEISFWWKVSSEIGYDWLDFYIGNTLQDGRSGEGDWQLRSFSVPAGTHTLKWQYEKDFSETHGSDCGWVDQVSWYPFWMTGTLGYNISGDNVTINVEQIRNPYATTSAPLTLQLWASEDGVVNDNISGYILGQAYLGTMSANQVLSNVSRTVPYTRPPDGDYKMTIMLADSTGWVDHFTFSGYESFVSPVYRFWSPVFSGHFFTISASEAQHIGATWPDIWHFEGAAWYARKNASAGTSPVYRFWSPVYSRHFFTISLAERNHIMATWPDIWHYEGVAWHAYVSAGSGRSPIYRFWSPVYNGHFFTISEAEKNYIQATWPDIWKYEGVAYYAYAVSAGAAPASTVYNDTKAELALANVSDAEDAAAPGAAVSYSLMNGKALAALREDSGSTLAYTVSSVTVTNEVGTYYPLSFADRYVTAMVYDHPGNVWRHVLPSTYSPDGIRLPEMPLGQRSWLAVMTGETGEGEWDLAHGSWFGRLVVKPEEAVARIADDVLTGVELPVETLEVPGVGVTVAVLVFCLHEEQYIHSETGLSSGAKYAFTVPAWNRWYRIDFVDESNGDILSSQWIGHERTHGAE